MKKSSYYAMSNDELFQHFQTERTGLDSREVRRRQLKYGYNTLPQKEQKSVLLIFLKELMDPIVILLMIAIMASVLVGEVVDAIAIACIILVDLVIGTYEEKKAETTIKALEKLVPENSRVCRNNQEIVIPSSELTIGDIGLD